MYPRGTPSRSPNATAIPEASSVKYRALWNPALPAALAMLP
jgi:hypothetical protein